MASSALLLPSLAKVLTRVLLCSSFLSMLVFYLATQFGQRDSEGLIGRNPPWNPIANGCSGLHSLQTSKDKCTYLLSPSAGRQCPRPQGYIDYLHLFYCGCGASPALGYAALLSWLLVLFYLLGDTAAAYLCPNLEGLSKLLRLPPTIAGATLLALGNGAPDAFSTIVSFAGSDATAVGLNSVLGGAFFVSSVVVGVIGLCVSGRGHNNTVAIDKVSFVRDIGFLLFAVSAILLVLVVGKITVVGAAAFTSLYLGYVLVVSLTLFCKKKGEVGAAGELEAQLVPCNSDTEEESKLKLDEESPERCKLRRILFILELPLYLPRRMTIPDASKERWSKPFAVLSVALAPLLLAALWSSKTEESPAVYFIGGLIGLVLGFTALFKTRPDRPPVRFLLPWLAGGFSMSVIWAYIVAQELLSLLVSIGLVLEISQSVLGVTVLAWGNSLGDLVANVTVALNGGPDGAQVAVSVCYAGPVFNTLVGLGLSLLSACLAEYPTPMAVPVDPALYQTMGFLVAGLLLASVLLPRRGMRVGRRLGIGLLAIYLCFLTVRLLQAVGLHQLQRYGPS